MANISLIIDDIRARDRYVERTLRNERHRSRSERLSGNQSLNGRDRPPSPEGWNRGRGSGNPRIPPPSGNTASFRQVERTDSTSSHRPNPSLRRQAPLPTRDTTIISHAEMTDSPSVHRVNPPTDAESAVIRPKESHGLPMTSEVASTPQAQATNFATVPDVDTSTASQSSRNHRTRVVAHRIKDDGNQLTELVGEWPIQISESHNSLQSDHAVIDTLRPQSPSPKRYTVGSPPDHSERLSNRRRSQRGQQGQEINGPAVTPDDGTDIQQSTPVSNDSQASGSKSSSPTSPA